MKSWKRNIESEHTRKHITEEYNEYLDTRNDSFCDCYLCCPPQEPLQCVDVQVIEDELYALVNHSVKITYNFIYINTEGVKIICTWESEMLKDMHNYNEYSIDGKIQTKSRFEMSHRPLVRRTFNKRK